jgi:hypothetical protein
MPRKTTNTCNSICFGLNRETDEQSLRLFIKKFGNDQFLNILIPRLADGEITSFVNFLTGLMHNHLTEKEYHRLFLDE